MMMIVRNSELLLTPLPFEALNRGPSPPSSADRQERSRNICVENMRVRGLYDFSELLSADEQPLYSWISRESTAAARRRFLHPSSPVVPSLCEQVLSEYPSINSPHSPHELRVRMLVDFVYRALPWRERGVEDAGISVYENLKLPLKLFPSLNSHASTNVNAAQFNGMDIEDLAAAFAYYDSGQGSVVCGGFAWMLSFTLQYFGYWAVVIDSKFRDSYVANEDGVVLNGHHTVMARICDDSARRCKWVHLDPSIGSVIAHTSTQQMASFFGVIESFYALQSNGGYSVVPAWTQPSGAQRQPRSLVPTDMMQVDCTQYWTLLDLCGAPLIATAVAGRVDDAKMVRAQRSLKNMVGEVLAPADRQAWWFHTTVTSPQHLQSHAFRSNCSANRIASAHPPCFDEDGSDCRTRIPVDFIERAHSELMKKVACPPMLYPSSKNDGKMRYLITDSEMRYIVLLMRCATMAPSIFSGPGGAAVQHCRDVVQSTSNQNPVTRSAPYERPHCVAKLEAYPVAKSKGHFSPWWGW